MNGLGEDDRGNEREIRRIGNVVGRDDVRDKVRVPEELDVTLFILSTTTHIGRQTNVNG